MTVKEIINNNDIKEGCTLYSYGINIINKYTLLYKYMNNEKGALLEKEQPYIERKEGVLAEEYVTKQYRTAVFFPASTHFEFFLTEGEAKQNSLKSYDDSIKRMQAERDRLLQQLKTNKK